MPSTHTHKFTLSSSRGQTCCSQTKFRVWWRWPFPLALKYLLAQPLPKCTVVPRQILINDPLTTLCQVLYNNAPIESFVAHEHVAIFFHHLCMKPLCPYNTMSQYTQAHVPKNPAQNKPRHHPGGPRHLWALNLVFSTPQLKVAKSAPQIQSEAFFRISIKTSLN